MKQKIALLLAALMLISLAACGNTNDGKITTDHSEQTETPSKATSLTILSSSPALQGAFQELAAAYRQQTGVDLKVETAQGASYGNALETALGRQNAPAIFELTSPEGYENMDRNCANLSDTSLATFLADKSLAMMSGDNLYAIPVDVTAYGLVYNEDVTDRYFALQNKNTSYASMDEINSFEKLKALAEDMQKHKQELGIEAVFADLPFKEGSTDWIGRMGSTPLYYDVKDKDGFDAPVLALREMKNLAMSLGDKLKDAFDLVTGNSVSGKEKLDTKTDKDAIEEFATGKAAMIYTGTDSYERMQQVENSTVKPEKLRLLPLYIGAEDEESMGLTVRANRYLAINANASDDQKQAAVDFLEWLFSSQAGKRFVKENLRFTAPFNTFSDEELSDDPLSRETVRSLSKSGVSSVPDLSGGYPGGSFDGDVSKGLLSYTRGESSWDNFMSDVKNGWNRAVEAGKDLLQID